MTARQLSGTRFRALGWRDIRERGYLRSEQLEQLDVITKVFPFRVNVYVLEHLIDWADVPNDPMFQLTFPQVGMLSDGDFSQVADALRCGVKQTIASTVREVRSRLNPHPDGQAENVPHFGSEMVDGVQHKYRETMLLFPSGGQTCHAYCSYCFRWPQFVGEPEWKFTASLGGNWLDYLAAHPEITDILLTGGDPMMLSADRLEAYLEPILTEARFAHVRTIRIGTKALAYWPARFVTDDDADALIRLFERVVQSGRQLAVMAHLSHPVELGTALASRAFERIRNSGAVMRAQAPLIRGVNDSGSIWAELWRREVAEGIVPYYMFVARQTGAQRYFAVSLERALEIYQEAIRSVSGLARTARGPVMSTTGGKILLDGTMKLGSENALVLRVLQSKDPSHTGAISLVTSSPGSQWLNDLRPIADDDGLLSFA